MSEYKQYRADFAKLAWLAALTTTTDSKQAAACAVAWADEFIAELERSEAPAERRKLSKEEVKKIFNAMPNELAGFCTDWGYLTFARRIEEAHGITLSPAPPRAC